MLRQSIDPLRWDVNGAKAEDFSSMMINKLAFSKFIPSPRDF